jgi:hypothetical protein
MSATAPRCGQCGAAMHVPADLSVLQMRCQYCGYTQPVPDFVARQHVLQQQQMQKQIADGIQSTGKSMTRMITIFVAATLVLSLGFTALMMLRSFGLLGD